MLKIKATDFACLSLPDFRGKFQDMTQKFKTSLLFVLLLSTLPGHAQAAPANTSRYFEGKVLIEQSADSDRCRETVGKTHDVQISWRETGKGNHKHLSGWIVYDGGAPGKLEGQKPGQMTVATNYYDAYMNTAISLSLEMSDGKVSGILHETPAKYAFGLPICYWQQARLTLTDKTADTDVAKRLREHAAWYKAHSHESRGDQYARDKHYAEAAAAYDQAIAVEDGVLPESHSHFKGLLNYTALLYAKGKDYERAAQRYQRYMDISVRQSKGDDTLLYHGWIRLAGYFYRARQSDKAIAVIERAASMEAKLNDIELNDRILRRRLQSNIYIAAKLFEKAQASFQDEITMVSAEAGVDDQRTFEARIQATRVLQASKDNAGFEAAVTPLVQEVTERFGESNELVRDSNELLGMYYYRADDIAQARPWLESAFRGHRAQFESAAQAIRNDEEALSILSLLLDIYIKQGIVPADFLESVSAKKVSLDELPFAKRQATPQSLSIFKLNPVSQPSQK